MFVHCSASLDRSTRYNYIQFFLLYLSRALDFCDCRFPPFLSLSICVADLTAPEAKRNTFVSINTTSHYLYFECYVCEMCLFENSVQSEKFGRHVQSEKSPPPPPHPPVALQERKTNKKKRRRKNHLKYQHYVKVYIYILIPKKL